MADRTGKVILAKNIRLDRDYQFTTDYSEANLVTALQTTAHLVASRTNCSFIRDEGKIEIEVPYGTAIQANYLAFQNPDYSNKWFFAFIDDVQYVAENDVLITYSIDHLSTWYDYWTPKPCFVTREHANTDVAGDNLIPETFELGEYVNNGTITELTGLLTTTPPYIGIITTYIPETPSTIYNASTICGVPTAGRLVIVKNVDALVFLMDAIANAGKLGNIQSVFLINHGCIDLANDCTQYWTTTGHLADTDYYLMKVNKEVPYTHDNTLSRPTSLNGFIPVNKKLLTYPFQALVLANNTGSSNVLSYEYFSTPSAPVIGFEGSPTVGGSIINYPKNYKGRAENLLEGVGGTKLPTLSWSGDAYTNWLTQNAINRSNQNIGVGVQAGNALMNAITTGALTGGLGFAGSAITGAIGVGQSIMGLTSERRQHEFVPATVSGQVNNGDIFTCSRDYGTYAIPVSIQYQFAERIDAYMTRFGYATNKIKIPNQTGRTNWNYVEIAGGESIGYSTGSISVPTESMSIINKAYQKGITIFHNIDNIGEFGLTNAIVTTTP